MPRAEASTSKSPAKAAAAPYTATSPKKAVPNTPATFKLPLQSYGFDDVEDTWISGWDAWNYFGTHRDLIAEHQLQGPGGKRFWLFQVEALAQFFNTPKEGKTVSQCRREFESKNQSVTEDIWASMGLGVDESCYERQDFDDDIPYEDEVPDTGLDADDYEPPEPTDEEMREDIITYIRDKKREELGSDFDSAEDYGSQMSDDGMDGYI